MKMGQGDYWVPWLLKMEVVTERKHCTKGCFYSGEQQTLVNRVPWPSDEWVNRYAGTVMGCSVFDHGVQILKYFQDWIYTFSSTQEYT